MIFLALYDQRGQCQRVAQATPDNAQAFLDAGFIEVSQDEYERCAQLVPIATQADLGNLQTATALLSRIDQQATRQIISVQTDTLSLIHI